MNGGGRRRRWRAQGHAAGHGALRSWRIVPSERTCGVFARAAAELEGRAAGSESRAPCSPSRASDKCDRCPCEGDRRPNWSLGPCIRWPPGRLAKWNKQASIAVHRQPGVHRSALQVPATGRSSGCRCRSRKTLSFEAPAHARAAPCAPGCRVQAAPPSRSCCARQRRAEGRL